MLPMEFERQIGNDCDSIRDKIIEFMTLKDKMALYGVSWGKKLYVVEASIFLGDICLQHFLKEDTYYF